MNERIFILPVTKVVQLLSMLTRAIYMTHNDFEKGTSC